MNIIKIKHPINSTCDLELLENFFKKDPESFEKDSESFENKYFRYYSSRPFTIVKNHYITILTKIDNQIFGYAHLDFDKLSNRFWFGIFIKEKWRGKGYGKKIIEWILNEVDNDIENKINEIYLSVDRDNINAIKLYEKYDFKVIEEKEKILIMKKEVDKKQRAICQIEQQNIALVCSHLGLGDMINMIGAVRYLTLKYDKIQLIVKKSYYENIKLFYEDCNKIEYLQVEDNFQHVFNEKINNLGTHIYSCGYHNFKSYFDKSFLKDIPNTFYDDFGLDRDIMYNYFYICKKNINYEIRNKIKEPYIFVHDVSSMGDLKITEKLINKFSKLDQIYSKLIINPNKLVYDTTSKYFELNKEIINKPLVWYIDLIENAEEIYLVDSSFLCLINFLNLKNVKNIYYVSRDNKEYNYLNIKFKRISIEKL